MARKRLMIKGFLNLFKVPVDILLSVLIIPSAFILLFFRKIGGHKLKLSKYVLKRVGVFPISTNYYEPQFNFDNLKKKLSDKRKLSGIEFNIQNQLTLLEKFNFNQEIEELDLENGTKNFRFNINNSFFGAGDAEIYYQMIRYFKPQKIIEVGSGHSSLIAKEAIFNNLKLDGIDTKLFCIEPYENQWLEKNNINVIRQKFENVDEKNFTDLSKNDILFIDSSHIIRPEGDVLKIFLEVLPKLNSEVIVHIHDIFSPRNYPEKWLKTENRFYNEQYILEAILTNTNRYEVICSLNLLKNDYFENLKNTCKHITNISEPSSFYLKIK